MPSAPPNTKNNTKIKTHKLFSELFPVLGAQAWLKFIRLVPATTLPGEPGYLGNGRVQPVHQRPVGTKTAPLHGSTHKEII
jgi:hypothetical protein